MSKQSTNYFSFLLRAWRDHEGSPWRFSLEGTHAGESLRFTELQGLVAFLESQVGAAASEASLPAEEGQEDGNPALATPPPLAAGRGARRRPVR